MMTYPSTHPAATTSFGLGFLLATSLLALGMAPGCASKPQAANNSAPVTTEGNAAQAGSEELGDERDLVAYEAMGDEAGETQRRLVQVGDMPTVPVKRAAAPMVAAEIHQVPDLVRDQWLTRRQAWRSRLQAQIASMPEDRAKLLAAYQATPWLVDHRLGTKQKTFSFSVDRNVSLAGVSRTMSRQVVLTRLVSSDERVILSSRIAMATTWSDGTSRTSSWAQSLQANGVLSNAFTSDTKMPGGESREVSWSKKLATDGAIEGSGTMVAHGPTGSDRSRSYKLHMGGLRDVPSLSLRHTGAASVVEVALPLEGEAKASTTTNLQNTPLVVAAHPALAVDASL